MQVIYQHHIDIEKHNENVDSILAEIKKYIDYHFHNLELSKFWFNKNQGNDNDKWHNHVGSTAVAILYLNVPKNSSHIEFRENKKIFRIDPEEGMLLIFDGEYEHRVPNPSSDDRISIAVNYKRTGVVTVTESAAVKIKDRLGSAAGMILKTEFDKFFLEVSKEPLMFGEQFLYRSRDVNIWVHGSLLKSLSNIVIDFENNDFKFINNSPAAGDVVSRAVGE